VKHLGEHNLCSLFGRGELGQGHKVGHLGEPVNNGENDSYLRTGTGRDREGAWGTRVNMDGEGTRGGRIGRNCSTAEAAVGTSGECGTEATAGTGWGCGIKVAAGAGGTQGMPDRNAGGCQGAAENGRGSDRSRGIPDRPGGGFQAAAGNGEGLGW